METTITEKLFDTLEEATIAQLRRQNEIMTAQIQEMRALIRAFPGKILSARLDQAEGKPTKYNYDKASKACEIRVA